MKFSVPKIFRTAQDIQNCRGRRISLLNPKVNKLSTLIFLFCIGDFGVISYCIIWFIIQQQFLLSNRALPLVRFDHVTSFAGQISANTPGQISPRELSTCIEFDFFCLHQNIADTDSASRFGSTGI